MNSVRPNESPCCPRSTDSHPTFVFPTTCCISKGILPLHDCKRAITAKCVHKQVLMGLYMFDLHTLGLCINSQISSKTYS